jgi:hypothetical protein
MVLTLAELTVWIVRLRTPTGASTSISRSAVEMASRQINLATGVAIGHGDKTTLPGVQHEHVVIAGYGEGAVGKM